jgi:hypothetical protein
MIVGLCTVELYLPDSQSLKAKRQVLLSLKDRLRDKFNISIADDRDGVRRERATTRQSSAGPMPECDAVEPVSRVDEISN